MRKYCLIILVFWLHFNVCCSRENIVQRDEITFLFFGRIPQPKVHLITDLCSKSTKQSLTAFSCYIANKLTQSVLKTTILSKELSELLRNRSFMSGNFSLKLFKQCSKPHKKEKITTCLLASLSRKNLSRLTFRSKKQVLMRLPKFPKHFQNFISLHYLRLEDLIMFCHHHQLNQEIRRSICFKYMHYKSTRSNNGTVTYISVPTFCVNLENLLYIKFWKRDIDNSCISLRRVLQPTEVYRQFNSISQFKDVKDNLHCYIQTGFKVRVGTRFEAHVTDSTLLSRENVTSYCYFACNNGALLKFSILGGRNTVYSNKSVNNITMIEIPFTITNCDDYGKDFFCAAVDRSEVYQQKMKLRPKFCKPWIREFKIINNDSIGDSQDPGHIIASCLIIVPRYSKKFILTYGITDKNLETRLIKNVTTTHESGMISIEIAARLKFTNCYNLVVRRVNCWLHASTMNSKFLSVIPLNHFEKRCIETNVIGQIYARLLIPLIIILATARYCILIYSKRTYLK